MENFLEKLKDFFRDKNQNGVYLPMVADPKTKSGSVTLTLLIVSSVIVMIGLAGKWSGKFGGIDVVNALQFFGICYAGYVGRKFQKDDKGAITIEPDKAKE
jgi:hypothetical protein